MTMYQVAYNQTTRIALIQANAAAVPGGSVNVGSFEHPDPIYASSEVVFHAVRDLLYKVSAADASEAAMFPDNITDMHNVTIELDDGIEPADLIVVTNMAFNLDEVTVEEAATVQLNLTVEPANATDEGVTYESSNVAVATVDENGLVTGVAAGEAIITATGENEEITATCTVTVTAG